MHIYFCNSEQVCHILQLLVGKSKLVLIKIVVKLMNYLTRSTEIVNFMSVETSIYLLYIFDLKSVKLLTRAGKSFFETASVKVKIM